MKTNVEGARQRQNLWMNRGAWENEEEVLNSNLWWAICHTPGAIGAYRNRLYNEYLCDYTAIIAWFAAVGKFGLARLQAKSEVRPSPPPLASTNGDEALVF